MIQHQGQRATDRLVFDHEAERLVISTLFYDPRVIPDVVKELKQTEFHQEENASLYQAMVDFYYSDFNPVLNLKDLVAYLKKGKLLDVGSPIDQAGGVGYIGKIAGEGGQVSNIKYYTTRIKEAALKRNCQLLAERILIKCQDQKSTIQQIRLLVGDIQSASSQTEQSRIYDLREVMTEHVIDKAISGELESKPGFSSGIPEWDKLTGGLRPGSLNIIAARPSEGKSTLGPIFAESLVNETGLPVLIFSLEMMAESLAWREFSRITGRKQTDIRVQAADGLTAAEKDEFNRVREQMPEGKYLVCDKAGLDMQSLIGICRAQHTKTGLGGVVVDYLQLLKADNNYRSRHEEVGNISGQLKQLSKDLSLPVVALCQLNRSGEDGNPSMRDMSQSDKINMDSDTVTMIHRKADEKTKSKKLEDVGSRDTGGVVFHQVIEKLVLTVAKAREGQRGKIEVDHHMGLFRIESPQMKREVEDSERFEQFDEFNELGFD
ncbi:MAG: hypothetical protein COA78_17105 [Blastopirellula sp.]|nr:MAG: hypothetical protein COA78_17105 [Blastopirellula sp.]